MARTLARAKGRRGGEAEHFAKIPASVLESEACLTLGHAAFRLLVIIASQYRGNNNGTMACTEVFSRRYRFKGRDTLYRGLADLRERGLLVRTRYGIKSKSSFSLYALGWAPVTHLEGRPLERPIAPADVVNAHGEQAVDWRHWKPESLPTIGNGAAEFQTDGRECPLPTIGNDGAVSRPMSATRGPLSLPTIGNTSRISGVERRSNSSSDPVQAPKSSSRMRAVAK